MDDARQLCTSLLAKIHEQIEGTKRLIDLLPPDCLDWPPPIPDAGPTGVLLGHLLDCVSGFCPFLSAFEPLRLAHFVSLRNVQVNHRCRPSEAARRIMTYRAHIDEGFMFPETRI